MTSAIIKSCACNFGVGQHVAKYCDVWALQTRLADYHNNPARSKDHEFSEK